VRIVQLIPPVGEGWRAAHYDEDDDEVFEVPIVAWALIERDGGQAIHAVGMYDLAASVKPDEPFTFTDEDTTFVELLPPPAYCTLEQTESPEELEGRIRQIGQSRKGRRLSEAGDRAEAAYARELAPTGG
jgi:hypothetical protein